VGGGRGRRQRGYNIIYYNLRSSSSGRGGSGGSSGGEGSNCVYNKYTINYK
jgi:hypothetical protein